MDSHTYTTTELLKTLQVPYWRLEHLIRADKVEPITRGRGIERRFTKEEFDKAERLLIGKLEVAFDVEPGT